VDTWYGVTIVIGHRVINLILYFNGLSGYIPPSISNLSKLQQLGLGYNQLSGNIPSSVGNLVDLQVLDVSYNQLSGGIPTSVTNLTNLTNLILYHNQLSGNIPSSIGNLIKLQFLTISDNHLSGDIPKSISKLINLYTIELENNYLSGIIPTSVGKFSDLNSLSLGNNQFIFTDIEHLIPIATGNTAITVFTYSPQANIPITVSNGKLYVSPGGTLANDTLRWYKVGKNKPVATITGDTSFTPTETGKYYAAVTNAVATQLTLYTDTVKVDAVLAATLLQFNAVLQNENIALLQWQTSGETNVDRFEIQRSTNAISFTPTGKVPANKNSAGTSSYSYSDNIVGIQAGTIYYRLLVIDKDGTAKPGNIITLNRRLPDAGFTVYPNPATDNAAVVFNTVKAEAYTIQLTNAAGKILQTKTGTSVAGENKVLINVSGYTQGLYFITLLNNEQGKITIKLNKGK
jgi:hypothetical protein